MSSRKDFFFRQRVTEAELDSAFDDLEAADHNLIGDLGCVGVVANAAVAQHAPVPDLTVDVSGPAAVYDQLGQRIFFSALQTVSVGQDANGVSTSVSAAGKERIVSVFVAFDRALSDPRIDGNSLTVFFRRDESFRFVVAQGAEGAAGGAAPPPLRSDAILLADVTRRFEQAQVLAADVSVARRQDAITLPGAPRALRRGRAIDAFADVLSFYNAHVGGSTDRHHAGAIDYDGAGAWADGSSNPASTVEQQLDKMISDLAGAGGAAKIGATGTAGAPTALPAGSVKSQLDALLGFLNGHLQDAVDAHTAAAIGYAGGPAWRDGALNPAATVQAQLEKIVGDLAADAGATRIGAPPRPSWLDGTPNPLSSAFEALAKLVTDLGAQADAGDGAGRIGAKASGHLAAGSVRSQLDALDATSVRTNVANVFAAAQTLNGAAGDAAAALLTTVAPQARKLLWQIKGATYNYRLYAAVQAIELVANAAWNGAQWVKDVPGVRSTRLALSNTDLRVLADDGAASPFVDWPNETVLSLSGKLQTFDAGGNWLSAGPTETYASAFMGGGGIVIGASGVFRKVFPATPSSVTFVITKQTNVPGTPALFDVTPTGATVYAATVVGNSSAQLTCRILAS